MTSFKVTRKSTWYLTSTETTRLIRDGEKGGRGYGGGGKREIIYLSLHCHHQNDTCIKTDSDESHFNVSVGSDGQSHKTVSVLKRKESRSGIEPRSFRLPAYNALPLGQTGSLEGTSPERSNLCTPLIAVSTAVWSRVTNMTISVACSL